MGGDNDPSFNYAQQEPPDDDMVSIVRSALPPRLAPLSPNAGRRRIGLVQHLQEENVDDYGAGAGAGGAAPRIPIQLPPQGTQRQYEVRFGFKFWDDPEPRVHDPNDLLAGLSDGLPLLPLKRKADGKPMTHEHITQADFLAKIRKFNKGGGYFTPLDQWVMTGPLGNAVYLSDASATQIFDEAMSWGKGLKGIEYVSFFEYLKKSNLKRIITQVDPSRYGDPLCPNDVLTDEIFFAAQTVTYPFDVPLTDEECNERLTMFLELTDLVTSSSRMADAGGAVNESDSNYLLDYLAHMVQPATRFTIPLVALIFYGRKGEGGGGGPKKMTCRPW